MNIPAPHPLMDNSEVHPTGFFRDSPAGLSPIAFSRFFYFPVPLLLPGSRLKDSTCTQGFVSGSDLRRIRARDSNAGQIWNWSISGFPLASVSNAQCPPPGFVHVTVLPAALQNLLPLLPYLPGRQSVLTNVLF